MTGLETDLCGVPLRNPVIAASGTCAYGVEFRKLVDWGAVGGIVIKGLSRDPIAGNAAPRLWETEAGMLNSVGLQNVGVRAFIADKLPGVRQLNTQVFANVFGYCEDDYLEVLRALEEAEGIAGYELNVSCPNTKHGGMYFSSDPGILGELVSASRKVARRPLMVKLSPNVGSIPLVAKAAEEAGADAISLVNTFRAMAIDVHTRRPRLGAGFGGLSGPAIKPIALRMVHEAAKSVRIPVIGLGGIASGEDAAEFLIAGATAVQVGTASFWDPAATTRIARELKAFLRREKIPRVAELVGSVKFES